MFAPDDLPDFDTVERFDFDGTLRETGEPVTWKMLALRLIARHDAGE